jgi:hypothetical protein
MLDEPWILSCACASAHCRGEIARFDALRPDVRSRYIGLGVVPRFVLEAARAPHERRAKGR